jgi:hypothetical protein
MSKETITMMGHKIEIDNQTGDTIDTAQLEERILLGDREGNLYWDGYIVPIGTWKIVNPEADGLKKELAENQQVIQELKAYEAEEHEQAEQWKKVATALYNQLVIADNCIDYSNMYDENKRSIVMEGTNTAIKQYEQLCK